MENTQTETGGSTGYLFLPGVSGGGVLVHQDQIVGARPNGPNQGAVVYTEAGPSLYTSLTTQDLANVLNAGRIEPQG